MYSKSKLIDKLNNDKIKYQLIEHEALFTVKDSNEKRGQIEGSHSKNLFLKNKKNQFFLFSCLESTKINLKELSKKINVGNISFANEQYLLKLLGVKPGAVTPFGLLNDKDNLVKFYFDKKFFLKKTVNFHPLINTATINIETTRLMSFLSENNKKVNIFNFENYTLDDK